MSASLSHVWKPSNARLVAVDSFVPVPRGSAVSTPPPLSWPAKDPDDVLDYMLDISPAIVGNDSDVISSVDVSFVPSRSGDLDLKSTTADGSRIILWLSGGLAGTVYTITFKITTISGRSLQRSVLLPVLALSMPAIPANAIVTSTGMMITDQNGNPVLS